MIIEERRQKIWFVFFTDLIISQQDILQLDNVFDFMPY